MARASRTRSSSAPGGAGVWTNIGAADTTSPYSVAWDTTAVADGLYDLRVITTDNAGNTFTPRKITRARRQQRIRQGQSRPCSHAANVRGTRHGELELDRRRRLRRRERPVPALTGWRRHLDRPEPRAGTRPQSDGLYDLVSSPPTMPATPSRRHPSRFASTTPIRPARSLLPPTQRNVRGTVSLSATPPTAAPASRTPSSSARRPVPASGRTQAPSWDTTPRGDGSTTCAWSPPTTPATPHLGDDHNVRVDNTEPTGSVTAPADAANVAQHDLPDEQLRRTGGSGVDTSPSSAPPPAQAPGRTRPPHNSIHTPRSADGLYDFASVTTDNAGNTFTSASITVLVDNTNPTGSGPHPPRPPTFAARSCSRNSADSPAAPVSTPSLSSAPRRRRHLDEPGPELEHDSAVRRPVRPPCPHHRQRRQLRHLGSDHRARRQHRPDRLRHRPRRQQPMCAARSA